MKPPRSSRSGRLLWGLLVGLGLAFLILLARHGRGEIAGLELDGFAALVVRVSLLVFFAGAVAAIFRHRLSDALEALVFWGLIGLLLAAGYTYRHDLLRVGDRIMAEMAPGRPAVRGHTVEFARSRGGAFTVALEINGSKVATVLDTGASAMVLTQDAAKAAGLPIDMLSYTVPVDTANGRTRAAAVTLDRVAVGSIIERAVPALVAQPGQLSVTLLGMTFLSRLESWEVRGDKLLLRGYP